MRDPVPGTGLPHQLPATFRELAAGQRYLADGEAALAAQERPDAACQAILRRHHDVLNFSVVLASPEAETAPAPGHSWWQQLDSQWSFLADRAPTELGEARIYLAKSAVPPGEYLDRLLPAAARITRWERSRAVTEGGLALWEAGPWADDRTVRRLVLAFDDGEEADRAAGTWAWSRGDTAIPPLARYLLHAAKLRARYREWHAEAGDRAPADGRVPADALRLAADLRALRKSAEIADHNMRLALGTDGPLAPDGPFTDDRNLAQWLQAQLTDDIAYVEIAADRAAAGPTRGQRTVPPARAVDVPIAADDITRNVFVVHGRDAQAAEALSGFLAALGLRPLDWEALVAATGTASPYLRDVITTGIAMAQAAVVLMTPDDTVWLHADLREPDDDEAAPAMQARPNVLLELGMALATYADRTVVLMAGKHRPAADLGGLNYIQLTDGDQCLDKIRRRLRTAGCRVSDEPADWRARGWFSALAAYGRRPRLGGG